jgi:hypothetical protein
MEAHIVSGVLDRVHDVFRPKPITRGGHERHRPRPRRVPGFTSAARGRTGTNVSSTPSCHSRHLAHLASWGARRSA